MRRQAGCFDRPGARGRRCRAGRRGQSVRRPLGYALVCLARSLPAPPARKRPGTRSVWRRAIRSSKARPTAPMTRRKRSTATNRLFESIERSVTRRATDSIRGMSNLNLRFGYPERRNNDRLFPDISDCGVACAASSLVEGFVDSALTRPFCCLAGVLPLVARTTLELFK